MNGIKELPIYTYLDRIVESIVAGNILLIDAEPGAGKTTLVPWKLLDAMNPKSGKIIMLEPRRIAARAAAERIAALRGERLGESVGLRTRLETIVGTKTRLEVVTEGILVRLIQDDPSLREYSIVIFDEFHERNMQGDMGLAFTWETREALRNDLSIVIMSATLPVNDLVRTYGTLPIVRIPGRTFPVECVYRPPLRNEPIWNGAARLIVEAVRANSSGGILVFLPGFREIRRTKEILDEKLKDRGIDIVVLHGSIPPEEQRRVIARDDGGPRRVILSTNVAEASITVPGVTAVVDCGYERRVRYSPRTGIDHRDTVRISESSAEQRKGRAGRLGPGRCYRWWDEHERLDTFTVPSILESDCAPLYMECARWGSAPGDCGFITQPPDASIARAKTLLCELGLVDEDGRLTQDGQKVVRIGVHPRIGRMLIDAQKSGQASSAILISALLEQDRLPGTGSDFRDWIDSWLNWIAGRNTDMRDGTGRRIQEEISRIARSAEIRFDRSKCDHDHAGELLLSAYPDRVARKTGDLREGKSRWILAGGHGAVLSGALSDEEFIVASEVEESGSEARILCAAPVPRTLIEDGSFGAASERYAIEWEGWCPFVRVRKMIGTLVISEKKGDISQEEIIAEEAIGRIMKEGLTSLPFSDRAKRFIARCRFFSAHGEQVEFPAFDEQTLLDEIGVWLIPFGCFSGGAVFDDDIVASALEARLSWKQRTSLDESVPEQITLPSGSRRPVDYESGEVPVLAARLQEFFGCVDTPAICGKQVLLHLLSPANRPVQITNDLGGFWDRGYPEVKKELAGRYPRHYWPDNPREAEPTSCAKPRGK
jgi:ATP-dependent helicase HrpB